MLCVIAYIMYYDTKLFLFNCGQNKSIEPFDYQL